MMVKNDEIALGLQFICDRPLFGHGYRCLLPEYFDQMPLDSGVLITPFLPTKHLLPEQTFPGDIDLLVVPFENDELVLSKTLAIELKVIRATFEKQGRSPNQFGFSQAEGLLKFGFPYVAVVHLIVSDESPVDAWQELYAAKVLDSDGRVSEPELIRVDNMPSNLTERAIGRLINEQLRQNAPRDIGLLACYLNDQHLVFPRGVPARPNPITSLKTLDAVADYYHARPKNFIQTRRW